MALAGCRICISGKLSITKKEMEDKILRASGTFAPSCSANTTYLIATPNEVQQGTSKVVMANKHGKPILSEGFVDACIRAGHIVDTTTFLLRSGAPSTAPNGPPASQVASASKGSSTAAAAADASQVMLAKKWEETDPKGWLMSEKLDGMRAYWSGQHFLSRNGNQLYPPLWFVVGLPPTPLDGELWLGRGQFQKCMSIVKKQTPTDDWKFIKYLVFDAPKHEEHGKPARFEDRMKAVVAQLAGSQYAQAVGFRECLGMDHLNSTLGEVEKAGGEGLMLRRPGSLYEWKRSSSLLKVKSFNDEEAEVIGHEKGSGKHSDKMGALLCRTPDGRQFSVGSGFTDDQRRRPPKIGSIITYRYQASCRRLGFYDLS